MKWRPANVKDLLEKVKAFLMSLDWKMVYRIAGAVAMVYATIYIIKVLR